MFDRYSWIDSTGSPIEIDLTIGPHENGIFFKVKVVVVTTGKCSSGRSRTPWMTRCSGMNRFDNRHHCTYKYHGLTKVKPEPIQLIRNGRDTSIGCVQKSKLSDYRYCG